MARAKCSSHFYLREFSACCKGVVAGDLRQMPRVVDGENADVIASAKFKTIDAAV